MFPSRRYRLRRSSCCLALILVVGSVEFFVTESQGADQTWTGGSGGSNTAWYTGTNWSGGAFPGSGSTTTNTDIATIPSTGSNPAIGINGATNATLYLGAISFTGANRIIGDSSATNFTLQLNGATVNSVANVILRNSGSGTLTLQNNGGGAGAMAIALGNTTNNIINIDGSGGITISSVIQNGAGNKLTLGGGGTGALTLSGANTYTGGTTINSGTLNIGNTNALGTGGLAMTGGTLDLRGFSISLANLAGTGGTITNANTNTLTTLTVGSDNTDTTFGGTLADSNGNRGLRLIKVGTGVLTLSGANTNSNTNSSAAGGTTINGGVLRLNNSAALPAMLLTINGGVLELQNPTSFTRGLGTGATNVRITGGTSGFSAFGSAATININNDASTLQWGSTNFNPTTFVLNETTATAALNFQNGIDLNGASRTINVNANTATINGAIVNNTGTGSLVKGGNGTLVLTNANTYNGSTTINGGTLSLDNAGTSSARLVNTSNVTINSGGTLLLANSSGSSIDRIRDAATVTLNGGTFNTGGLSEGTHGAAGVGALTLSANSTIDLGSGASILHFAASNGATWTSGLTLQILDWSGSQSGNGTDQLLFGTTSGGLTSGQLAEIQFVNPDGFAPGTYGAMILADGEITPIPEPSTWFAAALALLSVGYTQRRKLVPALKGFKVAMVNG